MSGQRRRAAALGVIGTAGSAGLCLALGRSAWLGWSVGGPVEVADALATVVTSAAAVAAAWAVIVLAGATADLVRDAVAMESPVRPHTGEPASLRGRVAAGLLAVAALSFTPTVASAQQLTVPVQVGAGLQPGSDVVSDQQVHPAAEDPSEEAELPTPGWTPTPPPAATPRQDADVTLLSTSAEQATDTDLAVREEVVVHRGDTLWDITARHLGPDATDADVAEAWPRWYAANEDRIGGDPDHIMPGQRLVVPTDEARR